MSPDKPPSRRYRPMRDITPFELSALIGERPTAHRLRDAAKSLADGFGLERGDGDGDGWILVGWTGREARAQEWVEVGGEPDRVPPADDL